LCNRTLERLPRNGPVRFPSVPPMTTDHHATTTMTGPDGKNRRRSVLPERNSRIDANRNSSRLPREYAEKARPSSSRYARDRAFFDQQLGERAAPAIAATLSMRKARPPRNLLARAKQMKNGIARRIPFSGVTQVVGNPQALRRCENLLSGVLVVDRHPARRSLRCAPCQGRVHHNLCPASKEGSRDQTTYPQPNDDEGARQSSPWEGRFLRDSNLFIL